MINQNWVFGNGAGLDFSQNPPIPFTSSINTSEGCASISDDAGNLLFYTDGINVWDSNHQLILQDSNNVPNLPNVPISSLTGDDSSTQSSIIVPRPGSNTEYYIFSISGSTGGNQPLGGILLDTQSPNIGTDAINFSDFLTGTIPNLANGSSPTEKLIAIQHQNCQDVWIITIEQTALTANNDFQGNGWFRVFLLTDTIFTHFNDFPIIDGNNNPISIFDQGYMKASSDGNWIAVANSHGGLHISTPRLLLFPFDSQTGNIDINNLENIFPAAPTSTNEGGIYGVEFSPDSQLLYYVGIGGSRNGNIYCTEIGNIANGERLLRRQQTNNYRALQLAQNGRIYISRFGDAALDFIDTPNALTASISNNSIALSANTLSRIGLPNLIANPCIDDCGCNDCEGCNENADEDRQELMDRAIQKEFIVASNNNSANCSNQPFPLPANCLNQALPNQLNIEPCFYFHWGDGVNDQIEEHDTEVFYITVCNSFSDLLFRGLKITQITINPNLPIDSAQIVPDKFINIDCLEPCTCQTREFAIITRDTNIAGNYTIDVEYCYEEVVFSNGGGQGLASFPLTITED